MENKTLAQKMLSLNSHLDSSRGHLNDAMDLAKEIQQDVGKLSEISALLGSLSKAADPSKPKRKRRSQEEIEAEKRLAANKGGA